MPEFWVLQDFAVARRCGNLRSRCRHEAWGVSPRTRGRHEQAREAGDSSGFGIDLSLAPRASKCFVGASWGLRSRLYAALASRADVFWGRVPGAYAPGFMLALAPRASL